jgi:hypothetical protein
LPGSDEDGDDADKLANASRFVGSGVLDGLSIGSDHQFDMSLCYGEIEGECGQGAIAEIAVFKGAMEEPDIEQLEKHLMQKVSEPGHRCHVPLLVLQFVVQLLKRTI